MSGHSALAGMRGSVFLADLGAGDRRPWRIALAIGGGIVLGLAAAFAALLVVLNLYLLFTGRADQGMEGIGRAALLLDSANGRQLGPSILMMAVPAATNGALVLAFVALAAVLSHHPLMAYVTAAPTVRWRLLVAGLALSVVVLAPLAVVDRLTSPGGGGLPLLMVSPVPLGRAAYGLAAVLLLVPAAAAEELFFRGWMLRQLAAFSRRPTFLILVTAIAFSAAHVSFSQGHVDLSLGAFLTRAIMGAGFAYMTLRLGGIEFSTGVHAANNILIVLLIEPLTLKTAAAPTDLTPGSLIEDVILVAGYVLITEAVARWPALREWAGVRPQEISATATA
ncbi:MAG TPA: CPBP family intramembrane glutamic endopeptidase [Caulobacteraceae bacterium]|nr:CPBP family intramembrane glutamic endopeptidase [Caulobacteraceae bacterium]